METVLTNAQLILDDKVEWGTLVFENGVLRAVEPGRSSVSGATDCQGDYVGPGLIEMHTDNAEKHFVPRPGVFWPDGLAAIIAHDAQLAASGVTTVYDSVCTGSIYSGKDHRQPIFVATLDAIAEGVAKDVFRIEHFIHLRCEVTADDLMDSIAPHLGNPLVKLASLMDHTPGQRQWRNLEDLKRYNVGSGEQTLEEHQQDVKFRMVQGPLNRARNWHQVVQALRARAIPIATHDDTTLQDVADGLASGAVISEFPTTMEAAREAHSKGLVTVAGAPNVVRGGSHSGGVSATALAKAGVLDALSSDYVPSSLLQAVLRLASEPEIGLPQAMGMVSWKLAPVLGLNDRGRLAPGLRADVVRFSALGRTPVVRSVWRAGERAF
jgi:alpha-D-ribose 1-methylphosphonate 5-triphosphate diphosphatase